MTGKSGNGHPAGWPTKSGLNDLLARVKEVERQREADRIAQKARRDRERAERNRRNAERRVRNKKK